MKSKTPKDLEYCFLNEIVKFKKEFGIEPNLFVIGGGVYHELSSMDCESFYTPQRTFKGDSFMMGIKLKIAEPFDSKNFDILSEYHTGTRIISVEHYKNSKFIDVTEDPKRSLCESCTKTEDDLIYDLFEKLKESDGWYIHGLEKSLKVI